MSSVVTLVLIFINNLLLGTIIYLIIKKTKKEKTNAIMDKNSRDEFLFGQIIQDRNTLN